MIDCSFYSPLIFFVNVNGYFGMIKGFGGVSSFGIVLELPSLQRFACIACPLLRFSLLSKDLQNLRRLCETDTQQLLVPFDPFKKLCCGSDEAFGSRSGAFSTKSSLVETFYFLSSTHLPNLNKLRKMGLKDTFQAKGKEFQESSQWDKVKTNCECSISLHLSSSVKF